jgi:hypothetical protein
MAVPYTFGTATAAIPLSQLDSNFATAITIGNTAVYLGNTTTSLGNVTLTNVTISSGTSNITTNVATVTGTLPEANGGTGTTTGYYGFKNRLINSAMVIDQRNAGASVTPTSGQYLTDRYVYEATQASKLTAQQNAGAVTPPVGFTKYLGVTSSSAYSVLTGDTFLFSQRIEGFNVADLAFGTASAATVTLSFWVRSSLTGTFGGSLCNGGLTRSYPFSYTISSANTWEQKTITVAGDTSGTWATDNTAGLNIRFGLGSGATYSGTSGAWASANYVQPTSTTSVVGTNGATFYITGVQLEKGSTATSFDYRPYGTELLLCQRYYYAQINVAGGTMQFGTVGQATSASSANGFTIPFPATMRVAPTALTTSTLSNFSLQPPTGGAYTVTTISALYGSQYQGALTVAVTGGAFTAGQATWMYSTTTNAFVGFAAEL